MGGTVLGVQACEETYNNNFFVEYSCVGASAGSVASICEDCGMFVITHPYIY